MMDMTGYVWINGMDIFDGYVSKLISKILKTYPYISYISFRILSYPFISSCSNTQMTSFFAFNSTCSLWCPRSLARPPFTLRFWPNILPLLLLKLHSTPTSPPPTRTPMLTTATSGTSAPLGSGGGELLRQDPRPSSGAGGVFGHIWLVPETSCYLDYDPARACSAGPDPT